MNRQRRKARYIKDVESPPSPCSPNQVVTQTWRVRNDSDAPWPAACDLLRVGGDVDVAEVVPNPKVAGGTTPGEVRDITVKVQAPSMAGTYQTFYRLAEANGPRFGQRLWCNITVASASSEEDGQETACRAPTRAVPLPALATDDDLVVLECDDFVDELSALSQMGFHDAQLNTQLLRDCDGNVNLVADHHLSGT